ncbi:DNA starvation/stationary phase protection protein [Spirosoma taeanense]|uniref:DNA starvation/stationary phase protection protein n=1 Tax=Spirosoma taeanense TaxID=2735870 RepID=A0A6M5YB81_9BACT|nr:DNA starvation/stationary phase protection protein [Spirosoma taeanense]QJW90606.1 DNA starvation/stationary phase protection protein [Spirosoma taeanense]
MTTDLNKPESQEKAVKNIKPNIGLDQDVLKKDNEMLNAYLSDLHVLYIKTRKYHWNVAGPSFKEYHEFFEEQYKALEEMIDEVAERIRTLGGKPFSTMSDFLKGTSLKEDESGEVKTRDMFERLLADHEQVTRELRENVDTCDEELKDAGTADFLTGLMEAHEKMAWMLRKYLS